MDLQRGGGTAGLPGEGRGGHGCYWCLLNSNRGRSGGADDGGDGGVASTRSARRGVARTDGIHAPSVQELRVRIRLGKELCLGVSMKQARRWQAGAPFQLIFAAIFFPSFSVSLLETLMSLAFFLPMRGSFPTAGGPPLLPVVRSLRRKLARSAMAILAIAAADSICGRVRGMDMTGVNVYVEVWVDVI